MKTHNDKFYILSIEDVEKNIENNREILSIVGKLQGEFDYLVKYNHILPGEYRVYSENLKTIRTLLTN